MQDAATTDSTGGRLIIRAVNSAAKAIAPTSPGIIGVGEWLDGTKTTVHGHQLAALSLRLFGPAEQGPSKVIVPIWFNDYLDERGQPAQDHLVDLVQQHRPDLRSH